MHEHQVTSSQQCWENDNGSRRSGRMAGYCLPSLAHRKAALRAYQAMATTRKLVLGCGLARREALGRRTAAITESRELISISKPPGSATSVQRIVLR